MDGARVTPRKDANWNVPLETQSVQLVFPMQSLGDGIFMHPNQDIYFLQWSHNLQKGYKKGDNCVVIQELPPIKAKGATKDVVVLVIS